MCTLYAIKTRNVPENFNEAKFIGFTMYTTLVIWVAFVAIYLSASEHKVTLLSLCISFSALFALFLLFFPKCYIIILKPEKNNRSFFTTTNQVRCHIGFSATTSSSQAATAAAANALTTLQSSLLQNQSQAQFSQRLSLSEADCERLQNNGRRRTDSGSLESALKSVSEQADQLRRQACDEPSEQLKTTSTTTHSVNTQNKPPNQNLTNNTNSNHQNQDLNKEQEDRNCATTPAACKPIM